MREVKEHNLKEVDKEVRKQLHGVTFFVEIRGKTPFDYVHFICVPLLKSELQRIRELFSDILEFSKKLFSPCVFFYFLDKDTVQGIVHGKKRTRFILPKERFFIYIDSGALDGFENASFQKINVYHDKSSELYSFYHKVYLSETSYCIDVDCFNGTIYEIKREGEELSYNQKVLREITLKAGYRYEIIRIGSSTP